jgi:hypothetical protein
MRSGTIWRVFLLHIILSRCLFTDDTYPKLNMIAQDNTVSEFIYHVMLMVSPPKASRGQIEKIRVLGTYTSIGKAKDAAHRGLFDKNVTYGVLRSCQIEQGILC